MFLLKSSVFIYCVQCDYLLQVDICPVNKQGPPHTVASGNSILLFILVTSRKSLKYIVYYSLRVGEE